MKYIEVSTDGAINFNQYFERLQELRATIPPNIFEFAANFRHYDLTSKESLHDAWLLGFHVDELGVGERKQIRKVNATLSLLGAFHDRVVTLKYFNVCEVAVQSRALDSSDGVGFGDLITHEFSVNELLDCCSHEIVFSTGSSIKLGFKEFQVESAFME